METVENIPLLIEKSAAQWASQYRKIKSSIKNDELCDYSFAGYEFLVDVHNDTASRKTLIKGAQVGATESALNITLHSIDMHGKDVLYLLPDDKSASDFSAGRFDPSIESSERLSNLFVEVSNVGHKRTSRANLYVRGAGRGSEKQSRSNLKSIPISILIMDEYDEIPATRVPLAEERVSAKQEYLIFKLSTPSIPNYGIDAEYKKSSMGMWMVQCPRCNGWQNLNINNLEWDGADEHTAFFKCKKCKVPIDDQMKREMIKNGDWSHAYPDNDHKGYWIPQFYSPTQNAVRICSKLKESQTDKAKEQEFYNSALGMAHIMEGAQLTKMDVEMCRGDYSMVNAANGAITAGIDVGSWLHMEVAMWEGKRKKVIWAGKVKEFEELSNLMKNFRVRVAVIDMMPEVRKSREFCKRHLGKVFMCRYGSSKEIITIDDKTYQVTANRTETLDLTLDRYRTAGELVVIPKNTTDEYIDHMCAPVRVYEKSQGGIATPVYRETGPDHYAHAANYDEIARMIFHKNGAGFISEELQEALQGARQTRDTAPNKMNW